MKSAKRAPPAEQRPPKVSVIISIDHTSPYLDECLASVDAQSLQEIEILCIISRRSGRSKKTVAAMARADSRYGVFPKDGPGTRGEYRNVGIDQARGDYVLFLDPEDQLNAPAALAQLLVIAESHGDDMVIGSTVCVSEPDGSERPLYPEILNRDLFNISLDGMPELIWLDRVGNRLLRKAYLVKNGIRFSPPSSGEDATFALQATLHAGSISIAQAATMRHFDTRRVSRPTALITRFYIIPRLGGLAYLNMAKSACSSILMALLQMRRGDDANLPRGVLPDGSQMIHGFNPPHAHMVYFFRRWPLQFPPLPAEIIKFSFVRNPYDRFYSFYKSKIVAGQSPGQYYERFGLKRDCSFEDCVRTLTQVDPGSLEHHAAPQSLILFDGEQVLADFVGKVEHFQTDWPVIQALTGLDVDLKRLNITPNDGQPAYTPELRDCIFRYYRDDFLLFNYPRDSVVTAKAVKSRSPQNPVHSDHRLPLEQLNQLKRQLGETGRRVRHLADTFAKDPGKRQSAQRHWEETLHELILKHTHHLECVLADARNALTVQRQQLTQTRQALAHFRRNAWQTAEGHGKAIRKQHKALREMQRLVRESQKHLGRYVLDQFASARKSWWCRLRRFLRHPRVCLLEARLLRRAGHVDQHYYFATYPDTIHAGITAAAHYVRHGAQEGRNPSGDFNTVMYWSITRKWPAGGSTP